MHHIKSVRMSLLELQSGFLHYQMGSVLGESCKTEFLSAGMQRWDIQKKNIQKI